MGIIGSRGLGQVRHIESGYLWRQDIVSMKRLSVRKVKGVEIPADLGTRHLKYEDIAKHLEFPSFQFRDGRTIAVPSIHKEGNSSSSLLSVCVLAGEASVRYAGRMCIFLVRYAGRINKLRVYFWGCVRYAGPFLFKLIVHCFF